MCGDASQATSSLRTICIWSKPSLQDDAVPTGQLLEVVRSPSFEGREHMEGSCHSLLFLTDSHEADTRSLTIDQSLPGRAPVPMWSSGQSHSPTLCPSEACLPLGPGGPGNPIPGWPTAPFSPGMPGRPGVPGKPRSPVLRKSSGQYGKCFRKP